MDLYGFIWIYGQTKELRRGPLTKIPKNDERRHLDQ